MYALLIVSYYIDTIQRRVDCNRIRLFGCKFGSDERSHVPSVSIQAKGKREFSVSVMNSCSVSVYLVNFLAVCFCLVSKQGSIHKTFKNKIQQWTDPS